MKNIVKDYQWPSCFITPNKEYISKYEKKFDNKLINSIESYFQEQYGFRVVLFPSARAGIGSILRFLKIDRSNEVFVNKWVSYCIFNTVGRFTNISTNFKNPDLALAIHKWGFKQIIPKKNNIEIIEDSVDSIITNKNDLFLNESEFEIVSLPKIIGSVSGGIVITKNESFYCFAKNEQTKNRELGQYQSRRKFEEVNKKKTFQTWFHHESMNTFLEYNSLLDIQKNIKNFNTNKNMLLKRRMIFRDNFQNIGLETDRLGPIIPIKYNMIKNYDLMNKFFLLRQIHENEFKIDSFKKVYLLPIHFKITSKKFNFYLETLTKCL